MRAPVVKLEHAEVRGTTAGSVDVFWGIPFARPPVGELRLAAPEPAELPKAVDATRPGAAAPQIESALGARIGIVSRNQDEDCLHLNVWTNARPGDRRPVFFWIHGGGFDTGSATNATTHATRLVERTGAVVVTVQYRLGVLGFLRVEGAPDNRGVLDLAEALRFVRRHIAEFGGDPENVTLMGSSAGGVCTLLLALEPERLFRRVIAHSAHVECVHSERHARRVAQVVYSALGWPHDITADDARRRLETVPIQTLIRAQKRAGTEHGPFVYGLPFQPVYRDVPPTDLAGRGAAEGIDFLLGTTRHEYRLARLAELGKDVDEAELQVRTSHLVSMARGHDRLARELIARYRSAPELRDAPALDVWSAIGTDYHFRYPVSRLARRLARRGRVHLYDLAFRARSFGGQLGACHAIEIPLVFGTYDTRLMRLLIAETVVSPRLSCEVQDAWVSFAEGRAPVMPNGWSWPAVDPEDPKATVIDETWSVSDRAYQFEREAWGVHWPVVAATGPSGNSHSMFAL